MFIVHFMVMTVANIIFQFQFSYQASEEKRQKFWVCYILVYWTNSRTFLVNEITFQAIEARCQRMAMCDEPSNGVLLKFKYPDGHISTRNFNLPESIQLRFSAWQNIKGFMVVQWIVIIGWYNTMSHMFLGFVCWTRNHFIKIIWEEFLWVNNGSWHESTSAPSITGWPQRICGRVGFFSLNLSV